MGIKPLVLPPSHALVGKGLWKCFASYAKVNRPKSWQFVVQQVLDMTGSSVIWLSPCSFFSSLTTCTNALRNICAPCPPGLPPSFFGGPFLAGSFWKSTPPSSCSGLPPLGLASSSSEIPRLSTLGRLPKCHLCCSCIVKRKVRAH